MPPESSKAGERSRRVSRLLQKAVDGLPERERRAVLEHLFEVALSGRGGEAPPMASAFVHGHGRLTPEEHERIERSLRQGRVEEALGAVRAAASSVGPETPLTTIHRPGPGPAQQMIPVRLTEEQHRRLKEWCAEHDFPMAVVIRGLVERFLDEQERRAA